MLNCFQDDIKAEEINRAAFSFHHKLLGHPALELSSLAHTLPALAANHITFTKGLLPVGADFESTFRGRYAGEVLEEIIENIKVTDSYVMASSLESHPTFAQLKKDLLADVGKLMSARGVSGDVLNSKLYLFLASPNSITPFHIDRYSTFLMQFRGRKQVSVFPPWDERVVTSPNREAYVTRKSTQLPWDANIDQHGKVFDFSPGEAIHIPFLAGHHVKNGGDDISISMSIIFNTAETMRWRRAICFNHTQRRIISPLGFAPFPVGRTQWRDSAKSLAWKIYAKARGMD